MSLTCCRFSSTAAVGHIIIIKTVSWLKCFKYFLVYFMHDRRPFLSQLWLVRSLLHCLVEGLFFMRVHDPIGRRESYSEIQEYQVAGCSHVGPSYCVLWWWKKRFSYVNIDVTSSYIQYLLVVTGKLEKENFLQNLLQNSGKWPESKKFPDTKPRQSDWQSR